MNPLYYSVFFVYYEIYHNDNFDSPSRTGKLKYSHIKVTECIFFFIWEPYTFAYIILIFRNSSHHILNSFCLVISFFNHLVTRRQEWCFLLSVLYFQHLAKFLVHRESSPNVSLKWLMFSIPASYVIRIPIRNLPFERPHAYSQNDHQKG